MARQRIERDLYVLPELNLRLIALGQAEVHHQQRQVFEIHYISTLAQKVTQVDLTNTSHTRKRGHYLCARQAGLCQLNLRLRHLQAGFALI